MGRHNILPGERCTVVVGMDTEPTVHMEFFQPGLRSVQRWNSTREA